ncbi:MAG: serine hydrolase domain-containing protein [Candidatus Hodarchaeota archaeon]
MDVDTKIKEIFSEWDKLDSPGCILGVIKNGEVIYTQGFGLANLDYGIPITPRTIFRIASVSKQFTAACIVLLAQHDLLSLDDDIRKYIPELPEFDSVVTIRHLVHHTSGLRDYCELFFLTGSDLREFDLWNEDDIFKWVKRQKSLDFQPGHQYAYSNTGYILLAVIIKRITGKTLREYADENIFKPLGMVHTFFKDDYKMVIKNRAVGYSPKTGGGFEIDDTNMVLIGDDGVFTNVDDLVLWAQNFYENKIGDERFISTLTTPGKFNSGEDSSYAFGLRLESLGELPIIRHGGSFFGFRAGITWIPQYTMAFVCLANLSTIEPLALINQVAQIYLKDEVKEKHFTTQKGNEQFIELSKKEYQDKIGKYLMQEFMVLCEIFLEDSQLKIKIGSQNFLIRPINKNHFVSVEGPFPIRLMFNEKQITVNTTSSSYILEPIEPPKFTSSQLKEFIGDYYSEELDVVYNITEEENSLIIKVKKEMGNLNPLFKDIFAARMNTLPYKPGIRITFSRDKQDKITGFSLSSQRASNILFNRKDQS